MLSVTNKIVIILDVIKLNVIMLTVAMLSVIMLRILVTQFFALPDKHSSLFCSATSKEE
jgi:hypothetical protein